MGIENGVERHIPTILGRGLNQPDWGQLAEVRKLYGEIFETPSLGQMERSREYLNSEARAAIGRFMGRMALVCGGQLAIDLTKKAIHRNGGSHEYKLDVGFLGQPTVRISKIRTMREGAEMEIRDPFDTTSLIGGDPSKIEDNRVLKEAEKFRKASLDEFEQFHDIANDIVDVVGVRGYTRQENRATEIMEMLVDNPAVDFDPFNKDILRVYRKTMAFYEPKPAMVSLLSGYKSKDTNHWVRLMLDLGYLWNASPVLDIKAFVLTMKNRVLGRVGAR